MNEELLRTVVAEGVTREIPQGTRRDIAIPKLAQRASVLKGVRRCGKTYRMFQRIHELMDAGVAREQVLLRTTAFRFAPTMSSVPSSKST